jgi:regulation of enolase protein 1 (concanavalin A-like superfamily)
LIQAVFRSGGVPGVEQSLRAQLLAADGEENRDLAILQVQGLKDPPQPISLSDLAEPEILMPVVIYGFPFGYIDNALDPSVRRNPSITVNRGSVSSLRKDRFNRLSHIQIDGSINPGNSGGPVADEKGRLVGISVAKIDGSNIGFAIPAAELSRMLEGRVGPIGLTLGGESAGQANLHAHARMIDSLNHVQIVHLLIAPAGSTPGGPDADGNWPALTGAQMVELSRQASTASASFKLGFPIARDRRLMVQAVYRLDAGRVVRTMPTPYVLLRPGSTPMGGEQAGPAINRPAAGFAALGPLIDSRAQPVKDCNLQRDQSSLTIEVPAGVRALSTQLDVHNAPMTLADVEGDFIAQVRVAGNMVPGTERPRFKVVLPGTFQGAGLLLWQDARNYIRVERTVSATPGKAALSTKALVEFIKGGRTAHVVYPMIPDGPLYIRIQRIGGAVTCLFGPDGRRWFSHEKLAVAYNPRVKVGLSAANVSRQPLTAQFEDFVLITEKKDVDAEKSTP